MTTVYRPSQVLKLVRAGIIADPQPRGTGVITCAEHGHVIPGDTESPTFWENGTYTWCPTCKARKLARVQFSGFIIDLGGERKSYPLTLEAS